MQDVRNALGKLVCRADRKLRRVEIVRKGQLTVLTFESNGTMPPARLSDDDSARRRYSFHALPIA